MKEYRDHDLKIFLDPLPEKAIKFMQDNFGISSAHELNADSADDLVMKLRVIGDHRDFDKSERLIPAEDTEYDIMLSEMCGYINFKFDTNHIYNPDIQMLLNQELS